MCRIAKLLFVRNIFEKTLDICHNMVYNVYALYAVYQVTSLSMTINMLLWCRPVLAKDGISIEIFSIAANILNIRKYSLRTFCYA